jgi:DNA-binding MarR family transcriptional regulator|tara:strand:+ start:66 stop:395 length:330 start_codon:yes stop_codon:yes gene_type:complete
LSRDNYLKNYRNILFDFRDSYGLKVSDIEFLFFVYDMEKFTTKHISVEYRCSNSFVTRNLPELLKKGYIKIYLERAHGRSRKYMISQNGKLLVTRFYRLLKETTYGTFK